MGGNIIPMLTSQGLAHVYDFSDNEVPGTTDRTVATGATSEAWTPTTTPTWIWSACTRSSTSTTASGRS